MQWVLKMLRKHLDNERRWLRYERIAADRKTAEGVRMAKERIPQLETALELLSKTEKKKAGPKVSAKQLNLFQLFK